jgi:GlpG protein
MRLVWRTTTEEEITHLKEKLDEQNISYTIEVEKEQAWESEHYGSIIYSLWINNDDDLEEAKELLQKIELSPSTQQISNNNNTPLSPLGEFLQQKFRISIQKEKKYSTAFWTLILLFISLGLFITDAYQYTNKAQPPSPLRQTLLFDYPSTPSSPYWEGFYTQLLSLLTKSEEVTPLSPELFAKRIQEGQLWRLISPIFLHGDLIHLIFNMFWLIFLGTQLEERLPKSRFFALIVILAALSNTAQYTMTGPLFIGFSGVACGMVGFIHTRQKRAPWEAYMLTPATYSFVFFFIFALAALSVATFFFEWFLDYTIPIGFANTAHISGLLAGLWLGRLPWFSAPTLNIH